MILESHVVWLFGMGAKEGSWEGLEEERCESPTTIL